MNLEERYNSAAANTYVGRVKQLQAADAGAREGVNFFDGDARGTWSPDSTAAPDQVQKEFTRNAAGDFRYDGGGKVPGTYTLSRWLQRGVEKGDTYLTNNRYTTVSDVRNANTIIQKYNWLKTDTNFVAYLSEFGKAKVNGSPSGPAPAGLNG